MAKVLIPLVDGFEDIEAVSAIDILRRGGVTVVTAALGETTEVTSAHDIVLRADGLFDELADEAYDAILLPGGPGTEQLRASGPLFERLRRQRAENGLICAICAAPIVLCESGVLDEETHITCYPTCVMELDRASAGVPVVADGRFITGQAPGSATLFALVVLRTLMGPAVAGKVARGLVTDVLD